jgi:2,4-dienoyl-CoA reductase-like NADH-dependent reductase (Old Yellow Enzyme family)
MPTLFDPIQLGDIKAANRIMMSPLTRGRATRDHVPVPIMADYYRQRASAGLIISEAIGISRQGLSWPYAPGIWTSEQVGGWRRVTDAVHQAGGHIVAQLWHQGRVAHPSVTGQQPVSASATRAPGLAHTYDGKQEYQEARALTREEIHQIRDDYVIAAQHALSAGFDGVQIHAANGYLIDQFLRDSSNHRDDEYGGRPENRVRLLREVTEAVAGNIGAGRTSVRLSPNGETQGVDDSDPTSLFGQAVQALDAIGLAFLELREQKPYGTFGQTDVPRLSPKLRPLFRGPLVLNNDYDAALARQDIEDGLADAISFGRAFLANPDLVERLRTDARLNEPLVAHYYSRGAEGYLDYPVLETSDR